MHKKWQTAVIVFILGLAIPGILLDRISKTNHSDVNTEIQQDTKHIQTDPDVTVSHDNIQISVLDCDSKVIMMELEEYITCVVLAEMPASFAEEALKAQAVVARTYTLRRLDGNSKHPGANVCVKSSCCQGFCSIKEYIEKGGTEESVKKVSDAVNDTSGIVLTYDGELIEATYFSCSGGVTEDAVAAWGEDIPYLQSTFSPGEENAANYVHTVKFTLDDFAGRLGIRSTGNGENLIGRITYTSGQGVETIEVGGMLFKGTQIRSKLGLNSTAFVITIIENNVIITTRGHGHRVGMSQYGADAMAANGSTFSEILSHYYLNTELIQYEDEFPAKQ